MKKSIPNLLACFILLASCTLLSNSENSKNDNDNNEPVINRNIVFSAPAGDDNEYQIFAMKEDRSELKQLTEGKGGSRNPVWGPKGEQIIFASGKNPGSVDLWMVNADGSNLHMLETPNGAPLIMQTVDWSPDGKKIVFDICFCGTGGIYDTYIYDLESEELTKISEKENRDDFGISPKWSPDGKKIAYISQRDYYDSNNSVGKADLYITDSDGSNLQRITENGYIGAPVWKPNGKEITVYYSQRDSSGIYQVDLQTGELRALIKDPAKNIRLEPQAWSEDGKTLLLTSFERSSDYYIDNTTMLYFYNSQDSSLTKFITRRSDKPQTAIYGADWYTDPSTSQ